MKTCNTCGVTKPLDEFAPDLRLISRRRGKCRACVRNDENSRRTPLTDRKKNLRKFGLSLEDYDRMLQAQSGGCAICGDDEIGMGTNGKVKPLAVDHDHKTGKVRGLLCGKCNKALGGMDDNPAKLRAAADYLESF